MGKPIPDYCYIGENNIHQETNQFGNDLPCLKDENECSSILKEVSQKMEDTMCKDNLKSFEEATEICAKYKNLNKPKRLKISKLQKSSRYQLRGRTKKFVSNINQPKNAKKCYPWYNVPLGRRTKTLEDLKKEDYQEFLDSDGAKQFENYSQKSRNILREWYDLDKTN